MRILQVSFECSDWVPPKHPLSEIATWDDGVASFLIERHHALTIRPQSQKNELCFYLFCKIQLLLMIKFLHFFFFPFAVIGGSCSLCVWLPPPHYYCSRSEIKYLLLRNSPHTIQYQQTRPAHRHEVDFYFTYVLTIPWTKFGGPNDFADHQWATQRDKIFIAEKQSPHKSIPANTTRPPAWSGFLFYVCSHHSVYKIWWTKRF